MFGKKQSQQSTDLTSAEAVERSQAVYDRITSGECQDARAELEAAHGTDRDAKHRG